MKKAIFLSLLILLTGIFTAAKVVSLPDVLKPERIVVDKDNAYITENATVYIYSLKDFKLKKKFGKPGEGPEEFKTNPSMPVIIVPEKDRILINSIGKISYFTKDGAFIQELKNTTPYNMALWPLGNQFVGRGFRREGNILYITIEVFDNKFKRVREIYKTPNSFQPGAQSPIKVFDKSFVFESYGDKIIVANDIELVVDVINPEGKNLYTIKHDYQLLPFTNAEKEKVLNFFKTNPGTRANYEAFKQRLEFPANYPAIQNFFASNEKINILTYEQKNDKVAVLVFDIKGKFLEKSTVPFFLQTPFDPFPFWIAYDKMYQVVDNEEEEEWQLLINDI